MDNRAKSEMAEVLRNSGLVETQGDHLKQTMRRIIVILLSLMLGIVVVETVILRAVMVRKARQTLVEEKPLSSRFLWHVIHTDYIPGVDRDAAWAICDGRYVQEVRGRKYPRTKQD